MFQQRSSDYKQKGAKSPLISCFVLSASLSRTVFKQELVNSIDLICIFITLCCFCKYTRISLRDHVFFSPVLFFCFFVLLSGMCHVHYQQVYDEIGVPLYVFISNKSSLFVVILLCQGDHNEIVV